MTSTNRQPFGARTLAEHFDGVYRKQGRFCIMFVSRYYAEKMWTRHQRLLRTRDVHWRSGLSTCSLRGSMTPRFPVCDPRLVIKTSEI